MTDFVHLHTRSWFSYLRGGSSPTRLVEQAAQHGMSALALTDYMSMSGQVEFQKACRDYGIQPIAGAEVAIGGDLLVLLARDRDGYTNLCALISALALSGTPGESSCAPDTLLRSHSDGLICLAGGKWSRLRGALASGDRRLARDDLLHYRDIFGEQFFVELTHHLEEGERRLVRDTHGLARELGIPVVGTNTVLYATHDEFAVYDLLTCIRVKQPVFRHHTERPVNGEAWLKPQAFLFPHVIENGEAFERTGMIAGLCHVDLLPEKIIPPAAMIPQHCRAAGYLEQLCQSALPERIAPEQRKQAEALLRKELSTILELELEEFFLVVREIVVEAASRGIRHAGRGSAANSLVCYLLRITNVNPVTHNLLFERFLHTGRKGTPDIDIDFDSDRRHEIIDWIEWRFGRDHTAMTGTYVRYGLRSALRDVAKAFGWPMETVNALSKSVPRRGLSSVEECRVSIEEVVGQSPLVDRLLDMVVALGDCPRHLGQHSGGMMLTRAPLARFSPVQLSANGVRIGQFDKDAVEGMGIIKMDVLGLRMLATISEAIELVAVSGGDLIDVAALDLEDPAVYDFICTGKTLALFQIESGGQMHLLAKSQPDCFRDLVTQVAIFRPGPVQSGMVHPYVRRKQGLEAVEYLHPDLEPILKDTLGVILFQEQILDIAHRFAGLSLTRADEFRRLMSRFRSHEGMAALKGEFVAGAMARGVPEETAETVFEKVSYFVGYGFCRSHAAAFAQIVFASAYLKLHHPAAYMAAIMQHRPGMYPQSALESEAARLGVPVLLPDIHHSGVRYRLEQDRRGRLCIRKPLTAIKNISQKEAGKIVFERLRGAFSSIEDVYRRVPVSRDGLEALARAGAFDSLAGGSPRRALWEVGVLANRIGTAGRDEEAALFALPALDENDIPELPDLTAMERTGWDYATHSGSRVHPLAIARRNLNEWEVRTITSLQRITDDIVVSNKPFMVTVAGLVLLRNRPATGKGVEFIFLEDETGYTQLVLWKDVQEKYRKILRRGALIVRGELQLVRNWRGIVVTDVFPLENVIGGYRGFASADGGRDSLDGITRSKSIPTSV